MAQERCLNSETWLQEAESAISDINNHVRNASISHKLKSNKYRVFINLTTLEGKTFCVEMSGYGFRIVGKHHDTANVTGEYYETPYAMLDKISEAYRKSFGGELMNKLYTLAKEQS